MDDISRPQANAHHAAPAREERTFGVWVRQVRIARDLTQESLAEQVGCATQTMRSFEIGRRRPSRDMALRLADVLQIADTEREEFLRLARLPLADSSGPNDPAPAQPDHMPNPGGSVIGRHRELQALQRLIIGERRRLVTLLGPGGVGKTRLALQAAHDLATQFADGAAVVVLASLSDPSDIASTIAAAIGCPLGGSRDDTTMLQNALAERTMLLVLDNLEHLLASGAGDGTRSLLQGLLRAAPGVTILATSRERIHIQAEWTVELAGLGLPESDSSDAIMHSEAVLLFIERARRATDRFSLTARNSASIAAICRRLDGLPLAIELAAAQVAFLPPEALLGRLAEALPLLEDADHDLPERQRTMRATIAWSDKLLQPAERRLFHRLAVFAGPFSLEAAEAVGSSLDAPPANLFKLLRRLIEQSLVVRLDSAAETAYYRLLEPIRQFALEQLAGRPDQALEAHRNLAEYYRSLALASEWRLRGPEQTDCLNQLEAHYPNIRATMNWLISSGDLESAAHIGRAVWLFLWLRGHLSEGQRWMEQVIERLPAETSLARAHALLAACVLAYGQARYVQSRAYAEAALGLYRELDDKPGLADAVAMSGLNAATRQDYEQAEHAMAEGVQRYLELHNYWGTAMVLNYWAPIPLARGDYQQVAALAERALGLARSIGDQVAVYSALYNLAMVAHREGNPHLAEHYFQEALTHALELGDLGNSVACLAGLGGVAAALGANARAARLWGAASALHTPGEAAIYSYASDPDWYAQLEASARSGLSALEWDRAWTEGKALSLQQAVAEARTPMHR